MVTATVRIKIDKTFEVSVPYAADEDSLIEAIYEKDSFTAMVLETALDALEIEECTLDPYEPSEDEEDQYFNRNL